MTDKPAQVNDSAPRIDASYIVLWLITGAMIGFTLTILFAPHWVLRGCQ